MQIYNNNLHHQNCQLLKTILKLSVHCYFLLQRCSVPLSLALCAYDIISEERNKTYQLAGQDVEDNLDPNIAFPTAPILSKLDAINQIHDIAVAMVLQLLQHGAKMNLAHPVSKHLDTILDKQNMDLAAERTEEGWFKEGSFSLQKLCRTCIRVHTTMGPHGLGGLKLLPLPAGIVQFLLFNQK